MDYAKSANIGLQQGTAGLGAATRTPAVDQVNQRLSGIHSFLMEAVGRVNMVANKVAGANPPTDKAGIPAAVPSCSMDWLSDIDRQIGELSTAITRLD